MATNGQVCVFLTSNEVAISAIPIIIPGKGEFRSSVGGVGPTFPRFVCVTLPKGARPTTSRRRPRSSAPALDAAGNIAFDVRPIVLTQVARLTTPSSVLRDSRL